MNTPDPRIDAPEATVIPADSHGAVDLSARASAPAAEGGAAPPAAPPPRPGPRPRGRGCTSR